MDKPDLQATIGRARNGMWRGLSLISKGIGELPSEIGQLIDLVWLEISFNQFTTLPHSIGHLTNLTRLNLVGNRLDKLPSELGELTNLTELIVLDNQLTALPSEIGQLTHLEWLVASANLLVTLPHEIGRLVNLTWLNISGNRLSMLPPEIGQLNNLRGLHLARNQLEKIPQEIGELTNLAWLNLSENQLTILLPEIGQLGSLKELKLAQNQLTTLPPEIGQLTALTELDVSGNELVSLPAEIGQLTALTELDLSGNELTSLPAEIGLLTNLHTLDLRNNHLPIPPELLGRVYDPSAILTYYVENIIQGTRLLNEAKILIVGQPGVGKTSLVRRLVTNEYNPDEEKTDGIDVEQWVKQINDEKVRLNIWDFGGQDIMHATHQFFLTKRSLYLLVLTEREESRVDYWLRLIETYGGDSPIIIVANKVDQHHPDLDKQELSRTHPLIQGFIYTSCKDGMGIDTLRESIDSIATQLKHFHDRLPLAWFRVKEQLEVMKQDFITHEDYIILCENKGLKQYESQRVLLSFLHDLGIVLHFPKQRHLQNLVLNPRWVTEGIYAIINNEPLRIQGGGLLHLEEMKNILDPTSYPSDLHELLINIMRRFELCFPLDSEDCYLIPDLLPVELPEIVRSFEEGLCFEYHYDALPSAIISRLLVRFHHLIVEGSIWRNGAILHDNRNEALVRADTIRGRLRILVRGKENTRRDFLAAIRVVLDDIHRSLSGIRAEARVPIPGHPDFKTISYEYLLELEERGRTTFIPEGMYDDISIRKLLNGVDPDREAKRKRWRGISVYVQGDYVQVHDISDATGISIGRAASSHVESPNPE